MFAALAALVQPFLVWTGYVQNGSTFPQPLSEEDEADCLRRMAAGDGEARNILIERNMRLVAHVVKKFDNTGEDLEDLISIGTIGLIKGIQTFDPTKGTRLATYAARCIENEILMHLRRTKRLRSDVSLHDPVGVDREGNEISYLDILCDEEDSVVDQVHNRYEGRHLREKLSLLDPKERRVIEMRYGIGTRRRHTQREIAWLMGISRSYVSRIEKRAIQNMGSLMERNSPQR